MSHISGLEEPFNDVPDVFEGYIRVIYRKIFQRSLQFARKFVCTKLPMK